MNSELAAKLDQAIGSFKKFHSQTFGERIVKRLDSLRSVDDLHFCDVLVERLHKVGRTWVLAYLTEKQAKRAWRVLLDENAVTPIEGEIEYLLRADIWGYEPGVGKAQTTRNMIIWAANDDEAKRIAEKEIGTSAQYRWSEWERDEDGWERHRTAVEFNASWMRIERADGGEVS